MFDEQETGFRMTKLQDMETKTDLTETNEIEESEEHSSQIRGTFVGTPLYASPEMLSCSISGPYTDLWALGVIVYQILVGEVPWKGGQEFVIFQQILDKKIEYPNSMPIEAVDLIDNLLSMNPYERLGAGEKGKPYDYEALKAHKFFEGLNFERIADGKISPPIPRDIIDNIDKIEADNQKKEHLDLFDMEP